MTLEWLNSINTGIKGLDILIGMFLAALIEVMALVALIFVLGFVCWIAENVYKRLDELRENGDKRND